MKIFIGILFALFALSCQARTVTTPANRTANADTTTAVCPASLAVPTLFVTCLNSNTEGCVVGGSGIAHATLTGIYLSPGASVEINGEISKGSSRKNIDCNLVFFEVGVNSEGISYTYSK